MTISQADNLARAVLMFHRVAKPSEWSSTQQTVWFMLTGSKEVTEKVLCDLADKVHEDEKFKRWHRYNPPQPRRKPRKMTETYLKVVFTLALTAATVLIIILARR